MKAEGLGRFLPIAAWLPSYNSAWLRFDVVAGLTTAAVVIPKAMAYATIAGLPAQIGLYTALIPMLVYALFGTARTLSFSATSTIAILVAAQIADLGPNADVATKIQIATTLAFLVGIALVICAVLRLGIVADLISDPVLVGFKAGIGLVIILDQLPKMLGEHITKNGFFRDIVSIVTNLPHASMTALTVGCVSLALILALERFAPKIPAPLVAVGLGIVASALFGLQNHDVPLLGKVPAGFPPFALPNFSLASALWPGALGIALMSFTESVAAGRAFSPPSNRPSPNGEMFAAGMANIAGSLFQSMPSGGGATQTGANTHAGARSQLAEIVTFLVILATLLFLSPLLALIPMSTLAAVIIAATLPMVSVPDFRDILETRQMEFWWGVTALAGVIWLGTLKGILVAVVLSIVMLVYSANRPPLYQLGRKPGTDVFRALTAEHPEDETFPGLLIVKTEGALTFASAPKLRDKLADLIGATSPRVILFDLSGVPIIDYTALKMLAQFEENSKEAGTDIWLASLTPSVLETIRRTALDKKMGRDHLFFNVPLAVEAYESRVS